MTVPTIMTSISCCIPHATGQSDWERPVQGKLIFSFDNGHHLSPEYIPEVSKDPDTLQIGVRWGDWDWWVEAMEAELDALSANERYLVGRKALKNKWTFKVKTNPNDTIERYKAGLVIDGFSEIKGVAWTTSFDITLRWSRSWISSCTRWRSGQ